MDGLSEEAKAQAREIFEGKVEGVTACQFCAGIHARVAGLDAAWQPCPRIKRVERHSDGTILVIEHWEPGSWERNVIFPDDVYDEADDPSPSS